ncbi:MAG: hypothetical protein FJW40_23245 [Acidobacteria bacterium]|nr:hypothetical protein [Acidobacteriota bacterium]
MNKAWRRQVRLLLAGLVLFYPAWWAGGSMALSATGLATTADVPWMASPMFAGPAMFGGRRLLPVLTGVAMLLAVASLWLLRRWPLAAGLLALGSTLAILRLAVTGRPGVAVSAACAAALAVTAAGGAWRAGSPAFLTGALAAFALAVHLTGRFPGGPWMPLAVAGAAMAAGGWLARRREPVGAPSWAMVAAGAVLSPVIWTGSLAVGTRLDAAREARERRETQAAMAGVTRPSPEEAYTVSFFQKGVNFTAEGPTNYRPGPAGAMLEQLKPLGVNAIALVPYAFMPRKDGGEVRFPERGGMEDPPGMEAIALMARQKGFRVMWKPQVWVGGGSFPGDVDIPDASQRRAWFASYTRYILFHAGIAARAHADIFCVGVEFAQLTKYEREWRELIAAVRGVYKGPLVYAAIQGQDFEQLRFWDALDYIGLNNYYPLPDSLDTAEMMAKVETVQKRFQKPVIFPEAGYTSLENPHRAPWDETPRRISLEDQARCYEALMRAFYRKPWFHGVYWWKVGTNGYGGPEDGWHTPWRKPAMAVAARWFQTGGR